MRPCNFWNKEEGEGLPLASTSGSFDKLNHHCFPLPLRLGGRRPLKPPQWCLGLSKGQYYKEKVLQKTENHVFCRTFLWFSDYCYSKKTYKNKKNEDFVGKKLLKNTLSKKNLPTENQKNPFL